MRFSSYFLSIMLIATMAACQSASENEVDPQLFHQEMLVFDTHNDVLITSIMQGADIGQSLDHGHTDLPRLRKGGVDVQVFAVWSDASGDFAFANQQIDALYQLIGKYPGEIELALNSSSLERIVSDGKIAALIGIEGGHMIEDRMDYLDSLHQRGAKYLTLTWNNSVSWATSATDESNPARDQERKGLSDFGREVIRHMNAIGMMVDLSHVGRQTFFDVMKVTSKPVLVTHSNAYALAPHPRNLYDDQIEAIRDNGGVIGINFYSGFVDSLYVKNVHNAYCEYVGEDAELYSTDQQLARLPAEGKESVRPPLDMLLDHLDYLVQKAGIDHVMLGSDFDGVDSTPVGLDDVADFPVLTRALLDRGYSQSDIRKIMGENMMRVMRENGI